MTITRSRVHAIKDLRMHREIKPEMLILKGYAINIIDYRFESSRMIK